MHEPACRGGTTASEVLERDTLIKWCLSAAWCVALSLVMSAMQRPAVDISGLWFAEVERGSVLDGTLSLEARDGKWMARLGQASAEGVARGQDIRIDFGSARGELRGRLSDDRRTITGHWIQPAGPVSYQPRATPVLLTRGASDVWQGEVVPLQERVSVSVHIARRDAAFVAVIRIPETNSWGNAVLDVRVAGASVTLAGTQNSIVGRYDADGDRLLLPVVGSSPQVFTRRSATQPSPFYPRTPWPARYTYAAPMARADGWPTGSATDAGMSEARLRMFVQAIVDADPSRQDTVHVHSVLIARHGRLVLEEYFNGFDAERPHDMRSAGKTIAPMLIGAVRQAGVSIAPTTPLTTVFNHFAPFAHNDARKSALTLEHVMSMTSGLACDDGDEASPGREDAMQSQTGQPDWARYVLDLPMVHEPGGTTAVYLLRRDPRGERGSGCRRAVAVTRSVCPVHRDAARVRPVPRQPDADWRDVRRWRHLPP